MDEGLEEGLRRAITTCGLSQRRLAARAGVHQPQVTWFIRGLQGLNLPAAGQIAAALGLELGPGPSRGESLEARLRQAIDSSGMSRRQLAERSGVDAVRLYRFSKGERTLTLRSADRIARVLSLAWQPVQPKRRARRSDSKR